MHDRRYRFDPTTPRTAGRLAALVVALLALALGALALVIDEAAVDTDQSLVVGGAGLAAALLLWFLPWSRLGRWAPVAVMVLVTGGLVGLDALTDLSTAPEAQAFYPAAWLLVIGWSGLTQTRGTVLAVAAVVGAAAVAVTRPATSTVPLAAAVLVVTSATLVAVGMAWALAGIRLGQRIERRREADIRTLAAQVGMLRSGRSTLEEIADLLARLAHEVFHGEHVSVVLSGQDGTLVPASCGDRGAPLSPGTEQLLFEAIDAAEVRLIGENGTTLLIIPLVGQSEIGGAVVVRQPRTGDDPFTQQLAVLFVSQAGPALEQFRIIGKLSEDLRRDEKLGIGNSRHAEALVQSLVAGDALVYIDLDNFKQVNDTYGHAAGDAVLVEFSDLLRDSVRDSDLVARVGGDEFIVIAHDAEFDAQPFANRLLRGWRATGEGRGFSAGVAIHDQNDLPAQTLNHADQAAYRAKRQGRNQVCLYPRGGWLDGEGPTLPPDPLPPSALPPEPLPVTRPTVAPVAGTDAVTPFRRRHDPRGDWRR